MNNFYISTVQPYSIRISGTIKSMFTGSKIKTVRLRTGVAVTSFIFFLFLSIIAEAQNCPTSGTSTMSANENTYYPAAQATVSAGATSITLGAVPSGYGATPIAVGDLIFIIQMQGAQINVPASATNTLYGANNSLSANKGMIATNLTAGRMEFAVATNSVGTGGGTLTLSSGLTYAYSNSAATATSGQYTFQVIRVASHYNVQLSANISTPAWNGAVGGVTLLNAINQFDFNGKTVSGKGAGFRGGGGRALSGQSGLNKYDNYDLASGSAMASKGEGIAGTPRYLYWAGGTYDNTAEGYPGGSFARGAPGNAGGGASDSDPASNDQNAGGGGGGNGGSGGMGGWGWQSGGITGGIGGTTFQTYGPTTTYYNPNRLIMGGGGGAGTTNNASGTPGGGAASGGSAGGGIVILSATTIIGSGTIDVSGAVGNTTVTVDGSGGGGAGGSVLIYAGSGHSGVTVNASGSAGSDNSPGSATQHGPGGGGGGGVVYSNGTLNAASSVTGGAAGFSYGSAVTYPNYGAVNGNTGILTQSYPFAQLPPNMQICQSAVLPVKILSFTASLESAQLAKILWSTTDEINADYFEVERSSNGISFSSVAQVFASNSISQVHSYSFNDPLTSVNSEIVFYRLRIVDLSGKSTFTNVIALKLDQPANTISVFPNPVDSYTTLSIYSEKQTGGMYRLIDNSGKQIITKSFNAYKGTNSITVDNLGSLSRGVYYLQIMLDNKLYNQKIIKR